MSGTAEALKRLEQELYLVNPETIVIISPHAATLPDAFQINLSATYRLDFKEFGDFQTSRSYASDFLLIDHVQRSIRKNSQLVLSSQEAVDYGTGIPLFFLTEHLPKITVVPVITSKLDLKAHYVFGKELKEEIMDSNKRVAVFASADLAHTLSKDAPAGFAQEGAEFDRTVQELLSTKNSSGVIGLDSKLCDKAQSCGIQPIATLLGVLDGVQYEPKIYSYEAPFGIGHLVANLVLS